VRFERWLGREEAWGLSRGEEEGEEVEGLVRRGRARLKGGQSRGCT
jgi:hypothetical protein